MSEANRKGQDGSKIVGVIGLGIMGGAIAKNLAAAGWQVIGFDIAKDSCDEAKAAGVEIAASAAGVATKATNILISLPKPDALMATVEAIADAKLLAPRHRRTLDLLARRQDASRRGAARSRSHDARLPA